MTHSNVWHDSFVSMTWPIHMCDMAHSYVRHDTFKCVIWLIRKYDVTHSYVWYGAFICVTCRIQMCDMTHSHVWYSAFICVTWRIHMCDMTFSHMRHDSFLHATYWIFVYMFCASHICVCDMTLSQEWHDSFPCTTPLIHMRAMTRCYICVTWPTHISDTNHSYLHHDFFLCATTKHTSQVFTYGVASISRLLKIIGLFCKRALYKRRYSAKETYNLKEPTNRSHSIAQLGCLLRPVTCVWHDSPARVTRLIHMCNMTDSSARHRNTNRSSRLLKIMGLFCKKPYKRDDILQKRPIILRSLQIVCFRIWGSSDY